MSAGSQTAAAPRPEFAPCPFSPYLRVDPGAAASPDPVFLLLRRNNHCNRFSRKTRTPRKTLKSRAPGACRANEVSRSCAREPAGRAPGATQSAAGPFPSCARGGRGAHAARPGRPRARITAAPGQRSPRAAKKGRRPGARAPGGTRLTASSGAQLPTLARPSAGPCPRAGGQRQPPSTPRRPESPAPRGVSAGGEGRTGQRRADPAQALSGQRARLAGEDLAGRRHPPCPSSDPGPYLAAGRSRGAEAEGKAARRRGWPRSPRAAPPLLRPGPACHLSSHWLLLIWPRPGHAHGSQWQAGPGGTPGKRLPTGEGGSCTCLKSLLRPLGVDSG